LVFLGTVLTLTLVFARFYLFDARLPWLGFLLFLFFTTFKLLEALLPFLISKIAPADVKGAAIGVFATSQFTEAFCGGLLGGWVYQVYGMDAVFLLGVALAVVWFLIAWSTVSPHLISTMKPC